MLADKKDNFDQTIRVGPSNYRLQVTQPPTYHEKSCSAVLPPHGSHSTSHHMHARPPDHQCTQPRSAQAEYPQLPRLHKWNSNRWKYWSIQLGFAHHLCIILRLLQSLGPENEWDKVGNRTTMLHKPMSALGLLLFDPILVCPSCETNIKHSNIRTDVDI